MTTMHKVLMVMLMFTAGCRSLDSNPAEQEQQKITAQLQAEAQAQVGMPDITNWTERRQFKDILELRDKPELLTYTYIVNMYGELLPLCQSIGYGLPYSVQYTSPQREERVYQGSIAMPQADPNGLYMPQGLSATWVLCMDQNGDTNPVYVEPEIIVSRFELDFGAWENPG